MPRARTGEPRSHPFEGILSDRNDFDPPRGRIGSAGRSELYWTPIIHLIYTIRRGYVCVDVPQQDEKVPIISVVPARIGEAVGLYRLRGW